MEELKQRIIDYFHHLSLYDYLGFAWFFVFFVFVVTLVIVLYKKVPKLSITLLLVSFLTLIFSPLLVKLYFDKTVRKVEILNQKITKLNFAKMLIIKGQIKNSGKIDYKKCRIFTKVIKKDENRYKNILNYLKPLEKKSILLDKELKKEDFEKFKIVLEKFALNKPYEVKVTGECY